MSYDGRISLKKRKLNNQNHQIIVEERKEKEMAEANALNQDERKRLTKAICKWFIANHPNEEWTFTKMTGNRTAIKQEAGLKETRVNEGCWEEAFGRLAEECGELGVSVAQFLARSPGGSALRSGCAVPGFPRWH